MFENVHVDTNGFFSTDCRVAVFSKWSSDIQKKYLKITGNYMSKFWKFIITGFMIVTGSLNGLFYAVKGQEAEKVDFVNLSSHGPLKITELTVNSEKIGLYEKFEISFDLEGEWDNPFDPDQIKLDFHAFPLRPKEVADSAQETVLEMGFFDSIYGRSKGGITPSGWICEHLPYLVEVDNWGASKVGGKASQVSGPNYWVWGYDEMSWFAHQTEQYRNDWLRYASNWLDDSRK